MKKKIDGLKLFCDAVKDIEGFYYSVNNPPLRNGKIIGYSKPRSLLEERFKMELFHQLRVRYKDLRIDGETQKQTSNHIQDLVNSKERLSIKRIKPDLIIHKSQIVNDPKYQFLVAEIKSGNPRKDRFFRDFLKLMIYREDLRFQYCIYLIVNCSVERVNRLIDMYKSENYYISEECNNIYVLVKPSVESEIIRIDL